MLFGIDEVGRGAWAGPLVFGAVGLGSNTSYAFIDELRDSKTLSKAKLEYLSNIIKQNLYYDFSEIEPEYIDKYGLTAASEKACLSLVENMSKKYKDFEVTIDGNINFLKSTPFVNISRCVIKGDTTITEVMAASVVAKVYRDKIMKKYADIYPEYGFDKNVGYGTRQHLSALKLHGVTKIHRKSYKPIKDLDVNEKH